MRVFVVAAMLVGRAAFAQCPYGDGYHANEAEACKKHPGDPHCANARNAAPQQLCLRGWVQGQNGPNSWAPRQQVNECGGDCAAKLEQARQNQLRYGASHYRYELSCVPIGGGAAQDNNELAEALRRQEEQRKAEEDKRIRALQGKAVALLHADGDDAPRSSESSRRLRAQLPDFDGPDPCELVDSALVERAHKQLPHLAALKEKLSAQIKKLSKDLERIHDDMSEYRHMQVEAARGEASVLLDAIPAGPAMDGLIRVGRATERDKRIVESAWAAAKAALATHDMMDSEARRSEQVKSASDAFSSVIESLAKGGAKEWNEKTQADVDGLLGSLKATGAVIAFAVELQDPNQPFPPPDGKQKLANIAKLCGDVLGAFVPGAAIAFAAEDVGLREYQKRIAQRAIDDLAFAMGQNYDARAHLKRKQEELDGLRIEYERALVQDKACGEQRAKGGLR